MKANKTQRQFLSGWLAILVVGSLTSALAINGCSGDDSGQAGAGNSAASGGSGASSSSGEGGNLLNDAGTSDADKPDACAQSSSEGTLTEKPVDIIMVAGNNGSLAQEIASVEANINDNFASIIEASGVDYRVILISRSGSHQFNICVEAPLGGTAQGQCALGDNNHEPIHNPPRFFHYSIPIDSNDAWCKLLGSYDGTVPDEYGQAPAGWSTWLRPESAKVLVLLSDSSTNCLYQNVDLDDGPQQPNASYIPDAEQAANDFDSFLLGLSALHFGSVDDRNYYFHNIVGLEAKDPNNATTPWLPADPLSLVKCSGDTNPVSPAIGYQAVSRLSGGLRFPICAYNDFDVVFNIIAQGIIDGVAVACELPVPEPPEGETLDPDTVEVKYTPGDGGPVQTFSQVADASACGPDSFYIEDNLIKLCPEACAIVQADTSAQLDVLYGCELDIN